MEHQFTENILSILRNKFAEDAKFIFDKSHLLQYINIKTKSANKGSKARGAFANHYALYVLIEDYIANNFHKEAGRYSKYEGAKFGSLFKRQRELPFGTKLQNHALNARLNDEFAKYFPTLGIKPIIRDQAGQRYWINEQLLLVQPAEKIINLPILLNIFGQLLKSNKLRIIMNEIIVQSKVEFNYTDYEIIP